MLYKSLKYIIGFFCGVGILTFICIGIEISKGEPDICSASNYLSLPMKYSRCYIEMNIEGRNYRWKVTPSSSNPN